MSTHKIAYGDTSHVLRATLPDSYGAVSGAFARLYDHAGENMVAGDVASIANLGGTSLVFTCAAAHYLVAGDVVTIDGTTSYDGERTITAVLGLTFTTAGTFVATETATYTAALKATMFTANTTAGATVAGALGFTLTNASAPTLVEDDTVALANPHEVVRIRSYTVATKAAVLFDRFRFAHATACPVTGRWLTYTLLAAADTDTFSAGKEFVVEWTVSGTDNLPFTEPGEVSKRTWALGDLESTFRVLYAHYHASIPGGAWDVHESAARDYLTMRARRGSRNAERVIDSECMRSPMLARIAQQVADGLGDEFASEREASARFATDAIDAWLSGHIWADDDQDLIEDDSEIQAADRPPPRRML